MRRPTPQNVRTVLLPVVLVLCVALSIRAQSASDRGIPAESKPGQSTTSTYERDKIETVNLANRSLSLYIPLVNIGGRGSASVTIALAYNSKVWTAHHDVEEGNPDPQFGYPAVDHWSAAYDGDFAGQPNGIGAGWRVSGVPSLKMQTVEIEPVAQTVCHASACGFKYVLSRMWLVLTDGSEIELRDNLTDGAPALTPYDSYGFHSSTDRDRGRVWHSADGSNIAYVGDATPSESNFSGWIFFPDGTRMRMSDIGFCTKIIDRNGNYVSFDSNGIADQLGRLITFSATETAQTVAVKGYGGIADRNFTINLAMIGALDGSNVLSNLRSDFRSVQRPFYSGDYLRIRDQDPTPHTDSSAHTDLFSGSENAEAVDLKVAVTSLQLPDGRSFRFRYNQYGEVAEIVYPGGGISQIDYAGSDSGVCESGPSILSSSLNRQVTQRRSLANGSDVDGVTTYATSSATVNSVNYPTVTIETHQGSATGTVLASEIHYFLAINSDYRNCTGTWGDGTGYEKWQNAKEFQVDRQTGNGTVTTKRTWAQRASVVWGNDVGQSVNVFANVRGQEQPPNDPRVTQEETIVENGRMKRVTFEYDNFNNVTLTKEYDFGNTSGSLGPLVRQTERTFGATSGGNYGISLNGICYSNLNPSDSSCGSGVVSATNTPSIIYQRHLLMNETVKDGNGNQKAYAEFEYDNYSTAANHAALITNSGMIHYDGTQFSGYSGSNEPRGNVTKTSRWAGSSNYIYSFVQYDNAGNVIWAKDPKGNVSTISYTDNFGSGSSPDSGSGGTNGATFALPTLATNALSHQAYTQYDYTHGVPTGIKDPNGVITKTEYDAYGRPTRVTAALGLSEQTYSDVSYPTASANLATSSKQLDASRWLASKTVMDGFDRPVESWQAEDGLYASSASFTIKVKTIYDGLGRVKQVSNPYRPATESAIYTATAFDLLGRVVSITTPDNAVVSTSYSGNEVSVTDQAGKKRKSITDGLGRLREVIEDPTTGGFNYETYYDYDELDDLVTVTQGSQTRTFAYDPLKRLLYATNPESGTVCYGTVASNQCQQDGYDANGNLLYKTDARGVRITYDYDALNRVLSRTYTDGTPTVTYAYDPTITNGKGRLSSVSSSVSSYSFSTYDALGRVKTASQTIYGSTNQTYGVSYGYNLAGNVTSLTYPSGHAVTYNYDNSGRLGDKDGSNLAFIGNLGDGSSRTYSRGIVYDAAGRMTKEQFGTTTAIYNKLYYNSRGQLGEIREGTSPNDTGAERGSIINYYSNNYGCWGASCNAPDNNGNLMKQEIDVPGSGGFAVQWFSYDALNRLQSANETWHNDSNNADTNVWKQTYIYDRYGNRTVDQNSANTYGGIPKPYFTVDTNTNRLTVPSGQTGTMHYDAAGNLDIDTYSAGAVSRLYDAENRMTKETQASSYVAGEYSYDGDGRRVKRKVGTVETWQVYGVGGELLAEYAANAAATSPQKEYGYRNGQLLITATSPLPGGAPSFSDNPVQAGVTNVKAAHVNEIRTAINSLRAHLGMAAYTWTKPTATAGVVATGGWITADPIAEMRTALDQALGAPIGGYASGLTTGQLVKAVHIQELRDRLTAASGSDVRWIVTDQLGTPRMIFDQTGSLASTVRHDYLPFGEELLAGTGGRTTAQGYSANDAVRQHFTDKERDNETGLDYFLARYYSSTQGRFTSPDEFTGGPEEIGVLGSGHPEKQALKYADVTNPQSLNKYQYSYNNPLRYVDPDGQSPQEGADLRQRQDIKDLMEHRITEKEYWERQNARAAGAGIGAAVVAGVVAAKEIAGAIFSWMVANPDKVQQIGQDLATMSSGNPAPAPGPGFYISAETRLSAAEISTGTRLMKQTGQSLMESPFKGEEVVNTAGKSFDFMGGTEAYKYFGNGRDFLKSVVHHVNKSVDYVAIDLKGASQKQIQAIQQFVGGLTKKQRDKIIYVQE